MFFIDEISGTICIHIRKAPDIIRLHIPHAIRDFKVAKLKGQFTRISKQGVLEYDSLLVDELSLYVVKLVDLDLCRVRDVFEHEFGQIVNLMVDGPRQPVYKEFSEHVQLDLLTHGFDDEQARDVQQNVPLHTQLSPPPVLLSFFGCEPKFFLIIGDHSPVANRGGLPTATPHQECFKVNGSP